MNYPWHTTLWQQVRASIDNDRLPHAILLSGAAGLGKTAFAMELARLLLCGDDSGDARPRQLLDAGTHPDLFFLRPEEKGKQIKVDEVRRLVSFIQLSSYSGRYKIAIIEPADVMNRSAANALLKTLEEPPPESVLVLVSAYPARLPVTVRSRCQKILFRPAADEIALDWLGTRQPGIPDAAELLQLARGAPLRALALSETGTVAAVREIIADLAALSETEADAVSVAEKWLAHDPRETFQWLLMIFSRMAWIKCLASTGKAAKSQIDKDLHHLSNELDLAALLSCYDFLLTSYHAATGPYNLNKQGQLEDFIVHWQFQAT